MNSRVPPVKPSSGLAFKAYEIEELADVYFFRPVGMVFARVAERLHLTPTTVTLIGMAVGVAGGVCLYVPGLGYVGFALLIFHGVLDSSDGQLARMTGQTSEIGRLLDGLGGYVAHAAIYLAIIARALVEGRSPWIVAVALAAAVANVAHALMYDYHRSSYARAAIQGAPRRSADVTGSEPSGLGRFYETLEAKLAGLHPEVEAVMAARGDAGSATEADRARYRQCFYWCVRGWNLMGDNTRFYAIGVLVWLNHIDWFFGFLLLPMSLAWVALWLWQARADRQFLEGL